MDVSLRNKKVALNRWKNVRLSNIGKKFDMLTIIAESGTIENLRPGYICKCDCGKTVIRNMAILTRKRNGCEIKSCGCHISTYFELEKNTEVYKSIESKINIKVLSFLRESIRRIISGIDFKYNVYEMLGYNKDTFVKHIENKFVTGMSWENYGSLWEFDHIIPISYYKKNNIFDVKLINRLDNIRPLIIHSNRKKYISFAP